MAASQNIRHAARVLHAGGVIAYPTEGVFGLGCIPENYSAVHNILDIKSRDESKGLILIFSDPEQIAAWIDLPIDELKLQAPGSNPVTWIIPASDEVPPWICGEHDSIAVRLTSHPVAKALCDEADSAIVSTSANISGRDPARNSLLLRRQFAALVDYIVPGRCGPATGPSEIRNYVTGDIVRPA
jgi:L-threonylcarbamoyladenylate synthase